MKKNQIPVENRFGVKQEYLECHLCGVEHRLTFYSIKGEQGFGLELPTRCPLWDSFCLTQQTPTELLRRWKKIQKAILNREAKLEKQGNYIRGFKIGEGT